MKLDYFEVEINGRTHPIPKHEFNPYEQSIGKKGLSISIWDSNIDAARSVISKYQIKHIKVSTTDLVFLEFPEFKNIIGLEIFGEIKNLEKIESLQKLRFLSLFNNRLGKIDFNKIPRLELLQCDFSENYKNLRSLVNLKNLYLKRYIAKDLKEFQSLKKLEELYLLFSKCEKIDGIQALQNIEKLTFDECKKLCSLDGIEKIKSLKKLIIVNCQNLNDYSFGHDIGNQCLALVDGKNVKEMSNSEKNVIGRLVENLKALGTSDEIITSIRKEIKVLEECNSENWKEILEECIKGLNRISLKHNAICTSEREEIISTIEYLLLDFDENLIEEIIDDKKNW